MSAQLMSRRLRSVGELEHVSQGQSVLARGARGLDVKAVQDGLIALGYGLRGGADGVFGASTESAVREFRALHGRIGAGVIDATTVGLLDQSLVRLERVDTYDPSNRRFTSCPPLVEAFAGQPLPRRGEAVRCVQQALLDLLFSLPKWGADGTLGGETSEALRRFQRWQKIRVGGELTALTLMALDEVVPPPNEQVVRYPEYDNLIRDGWLTVTVGVGYDEANSDPPQLQLLEQGLLEAGFSSAGAAAGNAVKVFQRALTGRQGSMRVRVVSRYTASPEDRFAEGLIQDAVTIYLGHARYGTGPDFDAKESTAENFVIGLGAPQHLTGELEPGYDPHMNEILRGVPNDLLSRRFDPQRDQLWAFVGCTTRNYLDELRALVAGKDTQNLDLILSTRPVYWSDMAHHGLAIVRSLLQGESINRTKKALCEQALATEKRQGKEQAGDPFMIDGFGDNAQAS